LLPWRNTFIKGELLVNSRRARSPPIFDFPEGRFRDIACVAKINTSDEFVGSSLFKGLDVAKIRCKKELKRPGPVRAGAPVLAPGAFACGGAPGGIARHTAFLDRNPAVFRA
jgi:hypothetical protein